MEGAKDTPAIEKFPSQVSLRMILVRNGNRDLHCNAA
jgi:hypothetical protein